MTSILEIFIIPVRYWMRSSVVVPFRLVTAMDYMVGSSLPATSTPNGGRKVGDQSLDITQGLVADSN